MAKPGRSDGCGRASALPPITDIQTPMAGLPPILSATPRTPDVSGRCSGCPQWTLGSGTEKVLTPLGMAANIMFGPIPSSQTLSPCYTCNISTPAVQVRHVHLLDGGMHHSAASISSPAAPCSFVRARPYVFSSHSMPVAVV